jgi:hypothetical protein
MPDTAATNDSSKIDLDALAKQFHEINRRRLRTDLKSGIELAAIAHKGKLGCEQQKKNFAEWAKENLGIKTAMAYRYVNLHEWTAGDENKERLDHITKKGMGVEQAHAYLRELQPDAKPKKTPKKAGAFELDKQLSRGHALISEALAKAWEQLTDDERQDHEAQLATTSMLDFIHLGAAAIMPEPAKEKMETPTTTATRPRPGHAEQPSAT